MKKNVRYTCLYHEGRAVVTSTDTIKDFHEVKDDGVFLCKVGNSNICTPFFYQSNDLAAAWAFADGTNKEFDYQQQRRDYLLGKTNSCPDSL